jgi:two-component system LytT family sensor kinase
MTTVDLSDAPPPARRRWRPFLAWTMAAVVYALILSNQVPLPWPVAARQSAIYVYSLAILIIPAQRFARRAIGGPMSRAMVVAGHVSFAVVTVAAWFGVNVLSDRLTLGPDFWQFIYANNWLFQLMSAATGYGTVMGLTIAAESSRRERTRERREAALLVQARDAELGAIRAQFQPHFVLNALNSLLALIDQDPSQARTMVVRLADVMKEVFDREHQPMVPLAREVELVRAYLDVEQIRFGSRLAMSFDIDPAASLVDVPAFLLQPIVENAVKHGIAPFTTGGRVSVTARRQGASLVVSVHDTGRGPTPVSTGTGRGLALTRRRLNTMFDDRATLDLTHTENTGTLVRIELPVEAHAR